MKLFLRNSLASVALAASALVASSASTTAQSMEVVAAKRTFVIDKADSAWHDFSVGVRNISSKTVPARVRVDKSRLAANHRVKFCFAMECYDESTTESSAGGGVSTLGPGEVDTSTFIGEFRPDGTVGNSIATFTFFSNSNADDKVSVELSFLVGGTTDVKDDVRSADIVCTPNPARDNFSVRVATGMRDEWTVTIADMQGNVVSSATNSADEITFSTTQLASGVYSVIVRSGSAVATSRLVVAH